MTQELPEREPQETSEPPQHPQGGSSLPPISNGPLVMARAPGTPPTEFQTTRTAKTHATTVSWATASKTTATTTTMLREREIPATSGNANASTSHGAGLNQNSSSSLPPAVAPTSVSSNGGINSSSSDQQQSQPAVVRQDTSAAPPAPRRVSTDKELVFLSIENPSAMSPEDYQKALELRAADAVTPIDYSKPNDPTYRVPHDHRFESSGPVMNMNSINQYMVNATSGYIHVPSVGKNGSPHVVGVHYRVGRKIGEGSFGVIYEGTEAPVLNRKPTL